MTTRKRARKPPAAKPEPAKEAAEGPTIESLRADATRLSGQLLAAQARVKAMREALIWCSGASDFAPPDYSGAPEGGPPKTPAGKAYEGWEKICRPLLAKEAAAAPEPAAAAAPPEPEKAEAAAQPAEDEAKRQAARDEFNRAFTLNAEVRIDSIVGSEPARSLEGDLRSYIAFLERKYGMTVHAIDYQKRPRGEYMRATTTLLPEKRRSGNWFALAG